jgi:5-methylcytosine-specific restriction endonuclease McrA
MVNKKYFISKEQLEPLIKKFKSVRRVLMELGYSGETGGGYDRFYRLIEEYNLDISHWGSNKQRMKWNKGLTRANSNIATNGYTAEEIFVENSAVSTQIVRCYLEGEPTFTHKCEKCGNTEWLGQKIALDLDHINGNNRDNRRKNLQFLCPNCHAQTHTYRGRNINKNKIKVSDNTFLEALKKATSIRQALMIAGLTPKGGNYMRAYELINKYNLNHLIKSSR